MGLFASWVYEGGGWRDVDVDDPGPGLRRPWLRISVYDSDLALVMYAPSGVGSGQAFLGRTPREYLSADQAPTDGKREAAGLAAWAFGAGVAGDVGARRDVLAGLLVSDESAGIPADEVLDDEAFVEETCLRFLDALGLPPPHRLVGNTDPSLNSLVDGGAGPVTAPVSYPASLERHELSVGTVSAEAASAMEVRQGLLTPPQQAYLSMGSISLEQAKNYAVDWVAGFFASVYPEAVALADQHPEMVIDRPATDTSGDVWGEPHGVWFKLDTPRPVPYTTAAVRRLTERLRPGRRFGATLMPLDDEGRLPRVHFDVYASVFLPQATDEESGWGLQLRWRCNDAARWSRAVEFTQRFAAGAPQAYGEIGPRFTPDGDRTHLALQLYREPPEWLDYRFMDAWWPGPVLPGYNWITIVPEHLARQISPPRQADGDKQLSQCERLPSGSLWVQATDHPNDFYGAPADILFDLFRGILPAGAPHPMDRSPWDRPYDYLVLQDPGDPGDPTAPRSP